MQMVEPSEPEDESASEGLYQIPIELQIELTFLELTKWVLRQAGPN